MELNMLELESRYVGAQPIISSFIKRLNLEALLQEELGLDDPRRKLPSLSIVLALLRNVTASRHPLYAVSEWLNRFTPEALDLYPDHLPLFNDDQIGRCLDRLFHANLAALQTRLIVHAVQAFDITLDELHNDSTTITFSGAYERPPAHASTPPAKITRGHNKDHRPDLKQLVFSLSVSADGNIPVHYSLLDGNITDDQTHIRTWNILRALRNSADFFYVADSKLCTRENMAHIADNDGSFITILPRTRSEDGYFKEHIQAHTPTYVEVLRRDNPRDPEHKPEVFEVVKEEYHTSEGYRLYWFRSSTKREADLLYRQSCLERAIKSLETLASGPALKRLKTRDEVMEAAHARVAEARAQRWLAVEVTERTESTFKQERPGRPGPNTRYVRVDKHLFELSWTFNAEQLRNDDRCDGLFPLVTNKKDLKALTVLTLYKGQAPLEKRFEQFKQVVEIMPVNLKSPERIEAFVFIHFLAMLIHALIEREIRAAMKVHGIESLPVYPERRKCVRPTSAKVLGLFEEQRRHRLMLLNRAVRTFWDPLSDVQRQVLALLGIPNESYGVRGDEA